MNKPFYKFLKDNANHDALIGSVSGNILFSKIPELNDFSETFALTDREEISKSLLKISHNGLDEQLLEMLTKHAKFLKKFSQDKVYSVVKHFQSQIISSGYTNNALNVLPEMLNEINKIVQDEIGIFCVSKNVKCFPMWAHYADDAKGFAVEYINLEEIFQGDETGELNELKKVNYSEKRPPVTLEPASLMAMLYSKHQDWSYEREHRVIKPLSECTKKILPDNSIKFFHKIDPEKHIKRIIVGWKGNFEEISEIVSKKCSSIEVIQAIVRNAEIIV